MPRSDFTTAAITTRLDIEGSIGRYELLGRISYAFCRNAELAGFRRRGLTAEYVYGADGSDERKFKITLHGKIRCISVSRLLRRTRDCTERRFIEIVIAKMIASAKCIKREVLYDRRRSTSTPVGAWWRASVNTESTTINRRAIEAMFREIGGN